MSPLRLSHLLIIMVVLLVLTPTSLVAQAGYRVDRIDVQATAENAVAAQAAAIADGQREGLRQLVEDLATGARQAAPSLAGVVVDDYVASFEVLSESVGPTSYVGTISVNYDREAVDRLLETQGIAVAAPAPPTTLVAVWETGAELLLWEPGNAWKTAWDDALDPQALASFVVPLGDLQDLSLLSADQAVRGDRAALARLAERYGTEEVLVARLIGSGAPGAPLTVDAQRFGGSDDDRYRTSVRRDRAEPLEASLERTVVEMQGVYSTRVRETSVAASGPREPVVVTAAITGLESWGGLLRYLEGLDGVEIDAVRQFSREAATLDLRVAGGSDRLRAELGRAGWALGADEAGGFRLERGSAPSGAPSL